MQIRSKKGTIYKISRIRRRHDKTFSAQVIITGSSGMVHPTIDMYFDENKHLVDYAGISSLPFGAKKVVEKAGFRA